MNLTVTSEPTAEVLAQIAAGLSAFNDTDVGPADRVQLAVTLRDDTGRLAGGLAGYTAWGWLYIQWLWLDEAHRGRGLAVRILDAAETEARSRACHSAWIDTFNPVALRVYEKHGYITFGRLDNFPVGRSRTFLEKKL